jgi:hypothetical protein
VHQEVELGVYLKPDHANAEAELSSPSSSAIFARRGSASSGVCKCVLRVEISGINGCVISL